MFTATRLNLSRFDNELRFRGQAHQDLTEVLNDPQVKAGLRCGPLTGPNHKIVPDSRWIAGTAEGTVLAREWVDRIEHQARDAAAGKENSKGEKIKPPDPDDLALARSTHDGGVAIVSRAASRSSSTPGGPRRRPAHPGPAGGLQAREDVEVLRRVCPLLSAAACAGRLGARRLLVLAAR